METACEHRLNGAAQPFGHAVAASDIVSSRQGDHLLLQLRGSTDTITVANYFRKNAAGGYVVEEVRWVDGMLCNLPARPAKAALAATATK